MDSVNDTNTNQFRTRQKQKLLDKLLMESDHILIQINPEFPGLVVPIHLTSQPTLTLKLSRLFRGDLRVEPTKIVAELVFGGSYHTCEIPMDAIWAVASSTGELFQWADCIPTQLLRSLQVDDTEVEEEDSEITSDEVTELIASSKEKERNRPSLRRIK